MAGIEAGVDAVDLILVVMTVYVAAGVMFALVFVTRVVGTWGFRVLIFPGSVVLWPLMLVKWLRGGVQ